MEVQSTLQLPRILLKALQIDEDNLSFPPTYTKIKVPSF